MTENIWVSAFVYFCIVAPTIFIVFCMVLLFLSMVYDWRERKRSEAEAKRRLERYHGHG